MLRERSSDIASFVEHHVYSNFKMYSLLILVFYFYLPLFTQNVSVKVVYSWTFRCSTKEAVILPYSWSTLYIAFQNVKVPDSVVAFDLLLFTQTVCIKAFILEILSAPRRKQWYCFFHGAPWIWHFQNVYCPDFSFFLFWFATIHPKYMCINNFLKKILSTSLKKQRCCFCGVHCS